MAARKSKSKGEGGSKVNVAALAEEYGVEGRVIRVIIRGLGMKAPAVKDQEGFGPRARYEWAENSKDLKKIREAIEEHKTNAPSKKKASKKKSSKGEAKAADEEDDEDMDEEDEEDEEEEDEDEDEDEDDEDDDD